MQSACDPCSHVSLRTGDADRNGGKLYQEYLGDYNDIDGLWILEPTYTKYRWSAELLIRNHPPVKRLRLLLDFSNSNLQHLLSHAFHPEANLKHSHSISFCIGNWKYSFIISSEAIAASQACAAAWRPLPWIGQPCHRQSLQSLDELSITILSCQLPETSGIAILLLNLER